MCHAESPCIICSCLLLIIFHFPAISPLKFNQQSLHVKNSKGLVVAKIPVEGIVSRKSSTTPQNNDLAILSFKGDGCDLAELQRSSIHMPRNDEIKFMVVLNTLNCDLATKIAHSHLSRISMVLFHNLATNDNPSSIVLEASDIISSDHPILVYFTGYTHGHLIMNKLMTPNEFFATVNPIKEKVFVDKKVLNGKENRKRSKVVRNQKSGPGPTSASFASMIYSETEFESFLESRVDFPPMAAFFGGMVLWVLQVGLLLVLIFAASFLIISVLFGLIYYYPFKFFRREVRSPSPDGSGTENDEIPEELNEQLLTRLMEMYNLMNTDEEFATARLPEEKIANLLKTILDESAATQFGVCGICEEVYQAGVEVTKLLPSCTHLFHTLCIEPWLRMASSCPLCRRVVTGKPESDSETDAEHEVGQ